jgi:hypothetical protein
MSLYKKTPHDAANIWGTIRPVLAAAMAKFYAIPSRQRNPLSGFFMSQPKPGEKLV